MTQHNANNDKSAKRSLWNAASPSRGFVTRAASALMFVGAAALMFAFPGSASDDAAVAPVAPGVVPQTFAEWREAGAPAPDDRWLAAEVGSFRLSRADDLSDRLIRAWQDRVRAEPERAVRQLHSRVLGENAIRHMFLDAAQNGEVGEVVDLDAAAWWKSYSEGYVVDIADSGIDAVLGYGEEQILAGAGFVRNVNLEYRSNLGGRQGQAAVEFLGPLRESARDAVVWQARGSFSEDSAPGANLGLIYRFAGDLPGSANRQALWGVNAFLDIQAEDEETFYRGSLGAEMRSGALDAYANFYLPLTDGVESGDDYVYTAEGFDFEVNFGVPGVDWASAVLGYYSWKGERGDDDQDGLRYGFRVRPPQGQLDVELELEYDQDQSDFGGRLAFSHVIGGDGPGAARSSFGGNFNPRDHFYDSVRREHAQRIRRVSAGVQVDNVYAAQGYNGVIANLTVTLAGENSYIHGVEVLAGGTVFVHSTTGGDSVGHDVIQLNLRSTRTIGEDQVNNPYRWDANITLAQGESRTTRRVAVDVYALAEAPPAETDMRFEISEAVANTDLITLSVPLPDNTRATVATFTKIGGHADLTVSDRGVVGATSDLPRSREAYTIVVAAEDETVASAVNRALGRQAETDLTGGKQFIGVFTITAEVQVGVISVGVASVTNGEVRAYYVGTDNEVNRIALEDDEIEYRAAPDAGYYVSGWTGTGQCSAAPVGDASESADIKTCGPITVSADLTVGASFAGGSYTVSYPASFENGSLSVSHANNSVVPSGTEVVFVATPVTPEYFVGSWTDTGGNIDPDNLPAGSFALIGDTTPKTLTVAIRDHSTIAPVFSPPIEVFRTRNAAIGHTGGVLVTVDMTEVDGTPDSSLAAYTVTGFAEADRGEGQFTYAVGTTPTDVVVDLVATVDATHTTSNPLFLRVPVQMSDGTNMTVRRIGISVLAVRPNPATAQVRIEPSAVDAGDPLFTVNIALADGTAASGVSYSGNNAANLPVGASDGIVSAGSNGLAAQAADYEVVVEATSPDFLGTQTFPTLGVRVGVLEVQFRVDADANGVVAAVRQSDSAPVTGDFGVVGSDTINFTATPSDGYYVSAWTGVCQDETANLSGNTGGAPQTCSKTVDGTNFASFRSVGATFTRRQLEVTFMPTNSNPGEGSLTGTSNGSPITSPMMVDHGANLVFTADPGANDAGINFGVGAWGGDASACDVPGTNVRSNVDDTATYTCALDTSAWAIDDNDIMVDVTFQPPKQVTLNVAFNEPGRGGVAIAGATNLGGGMWLVGAGVVVVQGVPGAAYHVGGWNGCDTGVTGAGFNQSGKTCTIDDLQDTGGITLEFMPGRLPDGIAETGNVNTDERAACEAFGGTVTEGSLPNCSAFTTVSAGNSCEFDKAEGTDLQTGNCINAFRNVRDCNALNLPAESSQSPANFGCDTSIATCNVGQIARGGSCVDVDERTVTFGAGEGGDLEVLNAAGATLSTGDTAMDGDTLVFTATPGFLRFVGPWEGDCSSWPSGSNADQSAQTCEVLVGADPVSVSVSFGSPTELFAGVAFEGQLWVGDVNAQGAAENEEDNEAICEALGGKVQETNVGGRGVNCTNLTKDAILGACPIITPFASNMSNCNDLFNLARMCFAQNKLVEDAPISAGGSGMCAEECILPLRAKGAGSASPNGTPSTCRDISQDTTRTALNTAKFSAALAESESLFRKAAFVPAPPASRGLPPGIPSVDDNANVPNTNDVCTAFGGQPLFAGALPSGFRLFLCVGLDINGNGCVVDSSSEAEVRTLDCQTAYNTARSCNVLNFRAATSNRCETLLPNGDEYFCDPNPNNEGRPNSCVRAIAGTGQVENLGGAVVPRCDADGNDVNDGTPLTHCPPIVDTSSGFAVAVAIKDVGTLSTTVESGQVVLQVTPAEADYVMSWTGCHDGSDPANPTGGVSTTGNAGDSANTAQTCTISDIMGDITATATTATRS